MPLYEYRCLQCQRKSTILVRTPQAEVNPGCGICGNAKTIRVMSRVAVHKSWGDSMNLASDEDFPEDMNQQNPKEVAQWMRRMQDESGEELSPEFDEMIEELQTGQSDGHE